MKIIDIKDRLMPMIDDAHWAEQALDKEDNQFTRRAYIRSMFAMIEGSIWVLKQTVLHAPTADGKPKRLSIAEYALLSDKSFELKNNGETKEQTKYLKLPENFKFTFNILSKSFGIKFDLGIGSTAWQNFLKAQEIRNRITHPKTAAEFEVSNAEILVCTEACSWFNELIANFFNGLTSNLKKG
jgi:hypothetical protein